MLTKDQVKKLPYGFIENHKLYGANDTAEVKENKSLGIRKATEPVYRNRHFQRMVRYAKTPHRAKIQIVKQFELIKKDLEEGIIKSIGEAYNSIGKLKARYIKRVLHFPAIHSK